MSTAQEHQSGDSTPSNKQAAKPAPSMRVLPVGSFLLNNLRKFQKYPDLVRLRLVGLDEFYLITSPTLIQEVLVTKQRHFIKGPFLQNTKKVFGEGLLTSEGAFHHRQRRLVQPAFHQERIKTYAEVMTRYEERLTGRWQNGETLDIHNQMTRLTMAIIAKCLFDRDVESDAQTISEDLYTTIEYFDRLSSPLAALLERLPTNRRYERAADRIDEFVYGLIRERRETGRSTGDLMSMLLAAQDETGAAMTDEQLRDEVLITFAAGHETTANALTWTWYLLSQNRDVEEKLHMEVDSILTGNRPPTADDFPKLEYTTKVLTESMRVYPPAWVLTREAANDCTIGDYQIKKGESILLSQYVTHHDPRFYDNPEKFDPDRWTAEMRSKLPKFAYFPFGGGARSCVGEPFAWMEGVLLLAAISRKWRMDHREDHKVEMSPMITLRPKHGMRMRLSLR